MGTSHRKAFEWKALVHEYERSDMTIKEFCRRREVNYWTFREWRQRLADEQPETQLVEIAPVDQPRVSCGSLRLTVGPVTIEIDAPVDEANLTAVLRAVERSRC
jgi:transposase-like protein